MKQDKRVCAELYAGMQAEEARYRGQWDEYKEQMKLKREAALATDKLKEADKALKGAKKERKHEEQVLAAMVSARAFTLPMLGNGKKKGGTQQNQKNRYEVLERVRAVAELSPEQTNNWHLFKIAWDEAMAVFHGDTWGETFAQMMKTVLDDLLAGKTDALSVFVENEKKRILSTVPALVIPAPAGG
jgi:ATPase subunit of ABC transporter with duplicated ATPase domains